MSAKAIWKFRLITDDAQFVSMPEGAQILSVQVQEGVGPCLWALVDPQTVPHKRVIQMRGTGHAADAVGDFIDTIQIGGLVFHVFDGGWA